LQRLQRLLGQRFAARRPSQSLSAWLRTLAARWPQQRTALEQLARLDEQQRYGRESDHHLRQRMLPLVDQLLRAARAQR
jgi:hypothetical protein